MSAMSASPPPPDPDVVLVESSDERSKNTRGAPPHMIREQYVASSEKRHNRPVSCTCKHCQSVVTDTRVEGLQQHTRECRSTPQAVKDAVLANLANKTFLDLTAPPTKRARGAQTPSGAGSSSGPSGQLTVDAMFNRFKPLPDDMQALLDSKLGLAIAMSGTPFHIVESPYWQDVFYSLARAGPGYQLPGEVGSCRAAMQRMHAWLHPRGTPPRRHSFAPRRHQAALHHHPLPGCQGRARGQREAQVAGGGQRDDRAGRLHRRFQERRAGRHHHL